MPGAAAALISSAGNEAASLPPIHQAFQTDPPAAITSSSDAGVRQKVAVACSKIIMSCLSISQVTRSSTFWLIDLILTQLEIVCTCRPGRGSQPISVRVRILGGISERTTMDFAST